MCLLLAAAANAQLPPLLRNQDGAGQAYTGVTRVTLGTRCTGFYLDTGGPPTAPAYVLTNGHCFNLLGPNDVLRDQTRNGATVTFHYFIDTPERRFDVPVRMVRYATMKGSDEAVLELAETNGGLAARGVSPVKLSVAPPESGEAIEVIGAPVTGVDPLQAFLRRAGCTYDGSVTTLELGFTFYDSQRNTCAGILGGSSGSPVFSARTGQAIGIINTSTIGSPPATECFLNHPCEVREEGTGAAVDTSYAIPLAGIGGCFVEGIWNLNAPGCPLDPGRQFRLDSRPSRSTQPQGQWVTDLLDAGAFTGFRYKTGPVQTTDCRRPEGYSSRIELSATNRIAFDVPRQEGRYFLCVVGEPGQRVEHASVLHLKVDSTPPVVPPSLDIRDDGEIYRVLVQYLPPELSLYQLKIGPADTTDCADPNGYFIPRTFQTLPKRDGPYRVCAIGFDDAGNATPPREYVLAPGFWEARRAAPFTVAETPVALVNAGGRLFALTTRSLWPYDDRSDRWLAPAPLPFADELYTAAAIAGRIYAVTAGAVWVFDSAAGLWAREAAPGLASIRPESRAAVVGERLFVAGVNTLDAYDPVARRWESRRPPPAERRGFSVVPFESRLYRIAAESTDEYDPATNAWRTRSTVPRTRSAPAVAVIRGRLVVAGGERSGDGAVAAVETHEYDSARDAWTARASRNVPARAASGAVLADRLFVLGPGTAPLEVFYLPQQGPPLPRAVVNAASGEPAFAAGSVVSLFGENLAQGELAAQDNRPVAQLNGVRVIRFGEVTLPVWYAGPNQVNVTLPRDLQPGDFDLFVSSAGVPAAAAFRTRIVAAAPAIFTTGAGAAYPEPVARGQVIELYATGIDRSALPRVTVGAVEAEVLSVVSPVVSPGLDLVRMRVPDAAPVGPAVRLELVSNGVAANTATLPVR